MKKQVSESLKDIGTIEDLPRLFGKNIFPHINDILKSENPDIVLYNIDVCNKILIPARNFLAGMKAAGKIILENDGIKVIDDNNKPESFIYKYGKILETHAFISTYMSTATFLSGYMIRKELEAIPLAFLAAVGIKNPKFLEDRASNDMLDFKKKNNGVVPKIVNIYLETLKKQTSP